MPAYALLQREVTCPYCWQRITVSVDPSEAQQHYIEDCAVCCHPIVFEVSCSASGEILSMAAKRDDD